MPLNNKRKIARIVSVAICAAALAGCGVDDVQLNGKIFDAMGMSTSSVKKGDPQIAQRQPLVIPPGVDGLPQPGSGQSDQSLAAIQDPDKIAGASLAEKQRLQEQYCEVHYRQALAHGDETGAQLAEGPLGRCQGSVLSAISNINKSNDAAEAQ